MPAGRKRRSPTCQQSLLLLIAGVVVGYPSWIGASHGMGSDDARQFRGCMSSLSWPARWLSFQDSSASCEIAVRAVTSPIASGTAVAVPRPDPAATDQISTHNVVQHRASLMGSPAAALTRLHVTLAAVVALATVVALRTGDGPRRLQATDDIIGLIGSSLCC
jgi:hypothetical protein